MCKPIREDPHSCIFPRCPARFFFGWLFVVALTLTGFLYPLLVSAPWYAEAYVKALREPVGSCTLRKFGDGYPCQIYPCSCGNAAREGDRCDFMDSYSVRVPGRLLWRVEVLHILYR